MSNDHETRGKQIDFYRAPGPMSTLPADVGEIPSDSRELARIVQGLLIHRDWAAAYDLASDEIRLDEQHLRTTIEILARVSELSDEPLNVEREPAQRVLGICRHFALLHTAFLRSHDVPARVRCGFSNYFDPSKWYDHWITERWQDGRWIREDPQIDALQTQVIKPNFDVFDQPPGKFLTGAEAWTAARSGDVDPELFGIFDMWGLGFIAGNVLSDFACVNKVELLPWDSWGMMSGPYDPISDDALATLDELAALVTADDIDAIRRRYDTDESLRVPAEIISFVDGEARGVSLSL